MLEQVRQDEEIRDLAQGLQETLAFANQCPDLLQIKGTTNVIEDIGRSILDVASLIDEYAKYPFTGMSIELPDFFSNQFANLTCFR